MKPRPQALLSLCAPPQLDAFGTAIEIMLCSGRTKNEMQTYTCVETKRIVSCPREFLVGLEKADYLSFVQYGLPYSKMCGSPVSRAMVVLQTEQPLLWGSRLMLRW